MSLARLLPGARREGRERTRAWAFAAVAALSCAGRSTVDLPSPVAHTSAASLDFGLSDCGSTGAALTLTNDATALPLSWTATVEGAFALVEPNEVVPRAVRWRP